ncbi:MAG: FAD-dependent oxidoreductase [Candidatus Eiseniibacteriota bacterium]
MSPASESGREPSALPVLFVVDADAEARERIAAALMRRFGTDYEVRVARTQPEGLAMLEQLANDGARVALVAADLALTPDEGGISFLEHAHVLHPHSSRVLLIAMDRRGTRIPFSALAALRRATALNRIDFWVVKGGFSPEEGLYLRIQEALSTWTRLHGPHHEVLRVVGEQWSPRSHELRETLTRNTVPYGFYPADSGRGRELILAHAVDVARLPAVILHDGSVIHEPTDLDLAHALGVQTKPSSQVHDLVVVGAGPAGLAAALYGASEGLRTLVLEERAIGGQAGTSSMIRNYLGFPRGVSGGDLVFRAWEQALLFGAEFVFAQRAIGLASRNGLNSLTLSQGDEVLGRAVVLAFGVEYRRLGVPSLERWTGAGLFYGAAGTEAPALEGERVCVVGGANSAGQAALHLSQFASHVTLIVRGAALEASMSDYLVRQIRATPNIDIRLRTRVAEGRGTERLAEIELENAESRRDTISTTAVFVMIGAEARTEWLGPAIRRDDHGLVLTGRDLLPDASLVDRAPLPFETSIPGVFAVGDVRHGSIKRVAEAVGEGSVVVGSVHQHLARNPPGILP